MKKLFGILLLAGVLFMNGCICGGDYKYRITANGNAYYTNDIRSVNGCIKFIDKDKTTMIICGQCIIKENSKWKKK